MSKICSVVRWEKYKAGDWFPGNLTGQNLKMHSETGQNEFAEVGLAKSSRVKTMQPCKLFKFGWLTATQTQSCLVRFIPPKPKQSPLN
jgi:hypothetical protein